MDGVAAVARLATERLRIPVEPTPAAWCVTSPLAPHDPRRPAHPRRVDQPPWGPAVPLAPRHRRPGSPPLSVRTRPGPRAGRRRHDRRRSRAARPSRPTGRNARSSHPAHGKHDVRSLIVRSSVQKMWKSSDPLEPRPQSRSARASARRAHPKLIGEEPRKSKQGNVARFRDAVRVRGL